MGPMKLVAFLGSVRDGRNVDRVWKLVKTVLDEKADFDVTVLDPLEMNLPSLSQPLHFMEDQSAAPKWMLDTNEKIKAADAFVVVCSEYNCSIPPALTNLMDFFPPDSYRHKPCAIVCYSMGHFGGTRAAALLRPFLSELGTVTIPTQTTIPQVDKNIDETGVPSDEKWKTMVQNTLKDLAWYSKRLQRKKKSKISQLLKCKKP